jgi:hypothetical protein
MKRIYFTLFLAAISSLAFAQEPIRNFDFKFKVSGLSDTTDSAVFLANYYGGKQYYYDTGLVENGIIRFKGDSIKGGIYSVITWDKKAYFEFVVNEPVIEMETNASNFISTMKVKTSAENKKFYEYLNFINDKSFNAQALKKRIEAEKDKASEEEKQNLQDALMAIDKEVISYKKDFIANNPDLFISKVFKASAEPEVPDYIEIEDEDERNKKRYL